MQFQSTWLPPSWQAARQLSGEDLKLLIAAKEKGAEGPTLLGFCWQQLLVTGSELPSG